MHWTCNITEATPTARSVPSRTPDAVATLVYKRVRASGFITGNASSRCPCLCAHERPVMRVLDDNQ